MLVYANVNVFHNTHIIISSQVFEYSTPKIYDDVVVFTALVRGLVTWRGLYLPSLPLCVAEHSMIFCVHSRILPLGSLQVCRCVTVCVLYAHMGECGSHMYK